MGHPYWLQAVFFVTVFAVIIAIPCVSMAIMGSQMINDLGNHPTKSAKIQADVFWKVFIVEMISFALLAVFFHIFK